MRSKPEASYAGVRSPGGCVVWRNVPGEDATELPLCLEIRNHSPTGFEWGYGGSGPAQLALALCVDAAGEKVARVVYQEFKMRMIAPLQGDAWTLSRRAVLDVVNALYREARRGEA